MLFIKFIHINACNHSSFIPKAIAKYALIYYTFCFHWICGLSPDFAVINIYHVFWCTDARVSPKRKWLKAEIIIGKICAFSTLQIMPNYFPKSSNFHFSIYYSTLQSHLYQHLILSIWHISFSIHLSCILYIYIYLFKSLYLHCLYIYICIIYICLWRETE